MSLRLSFIVPFYNVELYIEECIRSLYAQDIPWEEYEVICVDDCSPDGSRAIVERLQSEYPTLKLLTTPENLRQGGARNMGLEVAKGRYIWFVDSDDYILPNCLKKLLAQTQEENLDILQFNYQKESKHINVVDFNSARGILIGEKYLFEDHSPCWVERICGPWCQIYSKRFLLDNECFFIKYVQYEDTDYIIKTFLAAKRVLGVEECCYYYRTNEDSTTQSCISPIKLAWRVNQFVRCGQLIKKAKSSKAKQIIQEMVSNSLSQLRKEIKNFSSKQKKEYVQYITKDIKTCKPFMSWRTWLAIRYALTWFI